MDGRQRLAGAECRITDGCNAVRQRNLSERRITAENAGSDDFDTVGNGVFRCGVSCRIYQERFQILCIKGAADVCICRVILCNIERFQCGAACE